MLDILMYIRLRLYDDIFTTSFFHTLFLPQDVQSSHLILIELFFYINLYIHTTHARLIIHERCIVFLFIKSYG